MASGIAFNNMRALLRQFLRLNAKNGQNRLKIVRYGCARAFFGQNWPTTLHSISNQFNQRMTVLAECFEKQMHFFIIQRLKRTTQLFAFYNRLYGDKLLTLKSSPLRLKTPLGLVFGATVFSWEANKIKDSEIKSSVNDLFHIQDLIQKTKKGSSSETTDWVKIIDRPHLIVWRRPLDFNPNLYQYKVYGTFNDVPARAFFNVQIDVEFWKKWDKLSEDIKIVDEYQGSEVVHWTLSFPYPMHSRDYVYVRKHQIDLEHKVMVLCSRSIQHPNLPERQNIVRVIDYKSALVIKPHKDFDENGFEYVLTYYDDPQTTFPKLCYNWMASTGVPEFVEKLHQAAIRIQERTVLGQSQNNNNHYTVNRTVQQFA